MALPLISFPVRCNCGHPGHIEVDENSNRYGSVAVNLTLHHRISRLEVSKERLLEMRLVGFEYKEMLLELFSPHLAHCVLQPVANKIKLRRKAKW